MASGGTTIISATHDSKRQLQIRALLLLDLISLSPAPTLVWRTVMGASRRRVFGGGRWLQLREEAAGCAAADLAVGGVEVPLGFRGAGPGLAFFLFF